MIALNRQRSIDYYVSKFKSHYQGPPHEHFSSSLVIHGEEESTYLNNSLDLEAFIGVQKERIIQFLLGSSKPNTASIILLNPAIDIGRLSGHSPSIFEAIIRHASEHSSHYFHKSMLHGLFVREYRLTPHDDNFLVSFHSSCMKTPELYEFWCFARMCAKLGDADEIGKVAYNEKILHCILSFKTKRPIGYSYTSLLEIANTAMQSYTRNGDLLIGAMHKYGVYELILKEDRKGNFRKKIEKFNSFKPVQDHEFCQIAYRLFPELKEDVYSEGRENIS